MLLFWLGAILFFGAVNFVASLLILRRLSAAGVRVGTFEMRWQLHKHMKEYKRICRQDGSGLPGAYYAYWGSLGGLLLSLVGVVTMVGRPG